MLTENQRKQLWATSMREWSVKRESISLSKQELYDVFAIVDSEMSAIIELLRSKINSKAQLGLPERTWLRAIEMVVSERQKSEEKENPPPLKADTEAAAVEVIN